MKKKNSKQRISIWIMRGLILHLFLIFSIASVASVLPSSGQGVLQKKVSMSVENTKIRNVLKKLEQAAAIRFAYQPKLFDDNRKVSLAVEETQLITVLGILFNQGIAFDEVGKFVIIKPVLPVSSQAIAVSGKVVDETGSPLSGVNVVEKGTSNGTVTDAEGGLSLEVQSSSSILVFSFIGYETKEVTVGSQKNLEVTLKSDMKKLDEVVVVGYGSEKSKLISGSLSTVKPSDFANRPITQTSQLFYGLVPGVFANASTGEAGNGNATLRIRGVGTLNDASALILVDGIEAPINNIDPNDIKSVTVLKDAASAAIYGSRAANGVILITTKRGKFNSKMHIRYNGYNGVSAPTVLPKMVLDNATYLELYKEAAKNTNVKSDGITNTDIARYAQMPSTNWMDVIFRNNAAIQNHSVSLEAGSDNLSAFFSFGYLDQQGIIRETGFKRYNFRLNLDARISEKLRAGTSIAYSNEPADLASKEGPEYSANSTDVNSLNGKGSLAFESALTQHPIVPVYTPSGNYATLEQKLGIQRNRNNGQAILDNETLRQNDYKLLSNMFLEYLPVTSLSIKAVAGFRSNQTGYLDIRKQYPNYDAVTDALVATVIPGSFLTNTDNYSKNITLLLQATYERNFNKHSIVGILGFNQETQTQKNTAVLQTGFSSTSLMNLGNGATTLVAKTDRGEWALRSFFGRLSYNYAEKYLLEFNLRRDGSSRFGANQRYGNFPSISAGWIASNEHFWNAGFVNFLKFRASYGTLGNQNTALYPFASQVELTNNYTLNNINSNGAALTKLGNPDLRWESTTTTDVGINLHAFNSRFTLEADYFIRETKDILTPINNPLTLGVSNPTIVNAATVQNKGWEVSADYKVPVGQLMISVGGNFTHLTNKVTAINPALSANNDKVEVDGPSNMWLIRDQPVNVIYGYKVDGIFQSQKEIAESADHSLFGKAQPGDFKMQDTDGDKMITNKDRIVIGDRQPKWIYGFNCGLRFKGFDFSAIFQGIGKVNTYQSRQVGPFAFAGLRQEWLNRWTPENPGNTMPRLWIDRSGYNGKTIENLPCSFWVQDISYLRLKNIQVGYTLSKDQYGKLPFQSIRFYVNAQNPFTFTRYKDFDPERLTSEQYVTNSLPQLQIFTTGLNVSF